MSGRDHVLLTLYQWCQDEGAMAAWPRIERETLQWFERKVDAADAPDENSIRWFDAATRRLLGWPPAHMGGAVQAFEEKATCFICTADERWILHLYCRDHRPLKRWMGRQNRRLGRDTK